MTAVVVDSTVLIYLARLGDLDLLPRLFDEVFVPAPVYDEVVETGREQGYPDALAVEEALEAFGEVMGLPAAAADRAERLRDAADLGRGEAAAIALAGGHDARCLTDDHAARTTAESMGVAVGGTIYVLLEAVAAGALTTADYEARIDSLADGGFRMSAALYRRAMAAPEALDPDSSP